MKRWPLTVLLGLIVAVALFPVGGESIIDGDMEEWAVTAIQWHYKIPWDAVGFALALPFLAGLIVGAATWATITLLRRPVDSPRVPAGVLCIAIIAALVIVGILLTQPPSEYKHVFR
jgi:hypothetical protein